MLGGLELTEAGDPRLGLYRERALLAGLRDRSSPTVNGVVKETPQTTWGPTLLEAAKLEEWKRKSSTVSPIGSSKRKP